MGSEDRGISESLWTSQSEVWISEKGTLSQFEMKHKDWHPGMFPDLYMHAVWTCACLYTEKFKKNNLWYTMGYWKCFGGQLLQTISMLETWLTRWPIENIFFLSILVSVSLHEKLNEWYLEFSQKWKFAAKLFKQNEKQSHQHFLVDTSFLT